jgi:hypothetical protein
MNRYSIILASLIGLLVPAAAVAQSDDDPRTVAEKVANQAMAKALADKARNDAIVAEQRRREAAAAAKAKASKPASSDNSKAKYQ